MGIHSIIHFGYTGGGNSVSWFL